MYQTVINPVRNNNLFSRHYLNSLINRNPEWEREGHISPFNEIKQIFNEESAFLEHYNEKQLEDHFFKPIFKILGFEYEVTATTGFGEFPDFAFFADRDNLSDAHRNKEAISFFSNSLAIGEVKRWATDLDRFGRDKYNRNTNPSLQIWMYLHDTEPKWGILSNGALWRLYCKDRRRDEYFEINLPSIIISNDIEAFKFFYYFFRKEAFISTRDGEPFLDRVIKGSADYAQEIGEDLKKNVYRAMQRVAEGFIDWKQNQLDPLDPATLHLVQKNTMILLYRFLFLLYAEGKGLLDLDDPTYRESYSFSRLKKEVKEKIESPIHLRYLPSTRSLYTSLRDLFQLIDKGSIPLGIPKDLFYLPAYNGGLFDPQKHPELEQWRIGDSYLAEAIDLLSRSKPNGGPRDFVDYSTLEIRHLGSIYEGLLEYKLQLAESDLVASDGRWVTLKEYNEDRKQKKEFTDFDENDRVGAGHLYLITDKGERKSSGSYYTPDYIVNYIVKNTIEPVVEERWSAAQETYGGYIAATLSIKVLDPAMGSGHFLVGTVDYLAQKLLEAVQEDLHNGVISDASSYTTDWARREIVSHCIYGVDLNELAVELAKVGLWLTTISKDKPLSFLDHRLKQGNSLIGAKITDLAWYHEGDLQSAPNPSQRQIIPPVIVERILNKINTIERTGDDNLEDIKTKERLFQELQNLPEYQKVMQIADLNTSFYFGNRIEKTEYRIPASYYYDLVASLLGNDAEWKTRTRYQWFKKALTMGKEKSFFHWELEFPEIFFESGKLRDNPGWDVVIGNPPYIRAENADKEQRAYLMNSKHYQMLFGRFDIFLPFIEKGLVSLIRKGGNLGVIVPRALLRINYAKLVRKSVLEHYTLLSVVDFRDVQVFDEAAITTCIPIISKRFPSGDSVLKACYGNIGEITPIGDIPQQTFLMFPDNSIRLNLTPDILSIKEKMDSKSIVMGELCYCITGLVGHDSKTGESVDRLIHINPINEACKPYIEAKEWDGRYSSIVPTRYIEYIPEKMHRPKFPELFESPKILIQRLTSGDYIKATIDEDKVYVNHVLNCCTKHEDVIHLGSRLHIDLERISPDPNYNLRYVLALCCSRLIGFYHNQFLSPALDIFPETIRQLPVRQISFGNPNQRRQDLVEEAKELYKAFLLSGNNRELLSFIETRLSATQEESDVIHDVLAFLAEQMMELNKTKNEENKAFLDFIESEIGASIESLSNKTILKEYYTTDFANFAAIIVKNRRKLKTGYNPTSRASRENLRHEYVGSVEKLKPLIGMITATDSLIDQIVYRLYGLTPEEIEVIENLE